MSRVEKLSWKKKVIFYSIMVLFLILFLAVLAEVVLRIRTHDTAIRFSPTLLLEMAPNYKQDMISHNTYDNLNGLSDELGNGLYYVYTNNRGFRMVKDIPAKKGDDEYRILVFGDSYIEAVEVPAEERFTELLEEKLNGLNTSKKFFVINGATQGGSPVRYHLQLDEFIKRSDPDMVILIHGINDLSDDLENTELYGVLDNEEGYPAGFNTLGKIDLFIKRYYWTPRYMDWVYHNIVLTRILKVNDPLMEEVYQHNPWSLVSPDDAEFDEAIAQYKNKTGPYIVKFKERVEDKGLRFLLVLQAYRDFYQEPFYEPHYNKAYVDYTKSVRLVPDEREAAVVSYFDAQGVPVLSTWSGFSAFKEQHPDRKLFNYYGYQFSVYGHKLLAQEIFDYINQTYLPEIAKT